MAMDAILKGQWLEALRGGKYKQGRGALRDENNFCCLGVLCDVMGAAWTEEGDAYVNEELQSYYLSEIARRDAGLSDRQQEKLYKMNDDGISFAEIADYIDREL